MADKQPKEIIEYNEEIQKLLLSFMISDASGFAQSRQIIEPNYWNDRLRSSARFIVEYYDEYKVPPIAEQVKAETGVALDQFGPDVIISADRWFLDEIERFCRHKSIEAIVYDGPKLLSEGRYSELESRTKESMLISLQKDMGTDYFANPLERLKIMKDRTGMTSTGWKDIDAKLYGGMNRGELTFFAGGPGTGKSLFLQNLALNWVQMGLNVVYITLELSEALVGLRFDAMITEMQTREIMKNIDNTALKVSMAFKAHKWGKLHLKKMPEAGTNANMIRAYLKQYEIEHGRKPDALLVDYLDLLHPNSGKVSASDLFVKDKYTSEELRALAAEYNVLAATASQLNRASIQEQSFDASHMAGGISKINTADNVLGIYTNTQMKEVGQYQIQFLKTRSSSGVGSHVYLKFSPETLRITDHEENANLHVPSQFSKIQQELKGNIQTSVKAGPNVSDDEYKPGEAAKSSGQGSMLRSKLDQIRKDF